MTQGSIFDYFLEQKKITKPIRLIEFFAGVGSQYKALKQLTDKVESYKICEWAYNSIIAYNSIHIKDFKDYSEGKTKEELINRVRGISINYNEPLSDEQLNKKNINWLKSAYNNCVATDNLINVMSVKGKDLEIVDTDKYEYIVSYSFPCQDLSNAGKMAGMEVSQSQGGTRSGLLWEIERILSEIKEEGRELPQVLLMENVPQVIGTKNLSAFNRWYDRLEELGYKNYYSVLNAKEYSGIPQNRKRCFMISILGDFLYDFPKEIPLKYKLKDLLEKEVDEKYYLSKSMINYISATNEKWTGNNNGAIVNRDIGCTINTAPTSRRCDASNHICDDLRDAKNKFDREDRFRSSLTLANEKGISTCIRTRQRGDCTETYFIESGETVDEAMEKIKNINSDTFVSKAYKNYGSVPEMFNPYNQQEIKDVAPTVTTQCGSTTSSLTVLLKEELCENLINNKEVEEYDVINHSRDGKKVDDNGSSPTLTTRADELEVAVNDVYSQSEEKNNLRIRKLVPVECMKLMGFERKDYQAMVDCGLSDAGIYHCAGDSIVVPVLINIFGQLFDDIDSKSIIEQYVEKVVKE